MTEKYGLKQALQAVFKPVRDDSFDALLRLLDQQPQRSVDANATTER